MLLHKAIVDVSVRRGNYHSISVFNQFRRELGLAVEPLAFVAVVLDERIIVSDIGPFPSGLSLT